MKYQTKLVVCSKTGAQCELKIFKYGTASRYSEDTKKGVLEYLSNGGSKKDLYDTMAEFGASRGSCYANVCKWKTADFEQPIAYIRNKPKEAPSTRYENSTLSRLRKLLGF